jgi:MFS family permease
MRYSLFVGYVLMQIPSNMLITRVKPGMYMSSWMVIWAVVSACTGFVQSYGGLVACRFALGITEAPVRLYDLKIVGSN